MIVEVKNAVPLPSQSFMSEHIETIQSNVEQYLAKT